VQLGCYSVAVVHYTYTHKQYTERHKTNHRTTQKLWKSTDRAPSWRVIPWRKSTEKLQSG